MKLLGQGNDRIVYYNPENNTVIKQLRRKDSLSNLKEWELWQFVQDTHIAQYFCPVLEYTPEGLIVMPFLEDITAEDMWHFKNPPNVDDYLANYGFYNGRVVIRDYATIVPNEDLLNYDNWRTATEFALRSYKHDEGLMKDAYERLQREVA